LTGNLLRYFPGRPRRAAAGLGGPTSGSPAAVTHRPDLGGRSRCRRRRDQRCGIAVRDLPHRAPSMRRWRSGPRRGSGVGQQSRGISTVASTASGAASAVRRANAAASW